MVGALRESEEKGTGCFSPNTTGTENKQLVLLIRCVAELFRFGNQYACQL